MPTRPYPYNDDEFYELANERYDVDLAIELLATPIPQGAVRWRCMLCGCPSDYRLKPGVDPSIIGASCCGACGMACMRPIEEFPKEAENANS